MKTIMKRHCRLKNIKSNTKKKKPTNTLHNSTNELFTAIFARAFVFHPGTAVGVLACIILRQVRARDVSHMAAPLFVVEHTSRSLSALPFVQARAGGPIDKHHVRLMYNNLLFLHAPEVGVT